MGESQSVIHGGEEKPLAPSLTDGSSQHVGRTIYNL